MLSDISSGNDFSNNYNSLISGANEGSISGMVQSMSQPYHGQDAA